MICNKCGEEMVFTDTPKEMFSFKVFGREFMLLHMNHREWVCYTCPQEKRQEREDKIYQSGYEDCAKEIRESEPV